MRLKELRKENKKTQLELAEYLNTTSQSYGRYELGTSEPTIETLCKIADYYKVSLDYLVGRAFSNEFGYMKDSEKSLVVAFRQLSEVNQLKVISFISGILAVQE